MISCKQYNTLHIIYTFAKNLQNLKTYFITMKLEKIDKLFYKKML